MPSTTSSRLSRRGSSTWRRPNASSWRVRSAARSAAFAISSMSASCCGSCERRAEHAAVAADHEQDVVEVVRDAAGELADRLEALGLARAAPRARGAR